METLAILTGLEIDSAKSGVKPDLSPYLGKPRKQKNLFLTYKYQMEGEAEKKKRAAFLSATDWERVDSNLERLPYLAWQLEEHTPKLREPSQPDEVLFTFAQDPQWKEKLPQASRKLVEEIGFRIPACLGRIRASMAPVREQPHRTDVERILYGPGPGGAGDGGGAVRRLPPPWSRNRRRPCWRKSGSRYGSSCPLGSGRTSSGNTCPVTLWMPMESCSATSGQGATGFWGTCCWMWSGKTAWKPAASSTGRGTRNR